jgi:hypothetical protein
VIGDLNAHAMEFGCQSENEKGKYLLEALDDIAATTINNGEYTRLQAFPRISSAIDLAITR